MTCNNQAILEAKRLLHSEKCNIFFKDFGIFQYPFSKVLKVTHEIISSLYLRFDKLKKYPPLPKEKITSSRFDRAGMERGEKKRLVETFAILSMWRLI